MTDFTFKLIVSCLLASAIAGCGKDTEAPEAQLSAGSSTSEPAIGSAAGDDATDTAEWTVSSDMEVPAEELATDENLAAVLGSAEIPYPLYPNGSKYRIGGENGMKIVLFQTEDSFEDVDAFYQSQAKLPRLSAMNDYVRYSVDSDDKDPWATAKPGIVIHRFNNESERQAVGADGNAKTNIIMSFQ